MLLFIATVIAVQYVHLEQYLDQERLRQFGASHGVLLPLMYLAVWTVGPLFMPGLPITLAGGVLFGPFWGVVYTAIGSTLGAALVFLVARYLARDWVVAKLAGTRLMSLDDKVARHGWKIVALTRLIPVFSFSLLNYAFGLTRISFWPYLAATFVCMLPTTIAFVYFSSNLLDLVQGKISSRTDHRGDPDSCGEPHPGDLQMEEGQGRGSVGYLGRGRLTVDSSLAPWPRQWTCRLPPAAMIPP